MTSGTEREQGLGSEGQNEAAPSPPPSPVPPVVYFEKFQTHRKVERIVKQSSVASSPKFTIVYARAQRPPWPASPPTCLVFACPSSSCPCCRILMILSHLRKLRSVHGVRAEIFSAFPQMSLTAFFPLFCVQNAGHVHALPWVVLSVLICDGHLAPPTHMYFFMTLFFRNLVSCPVKCSASRCCLIFSQD